MPEETKLAQECKNAQKTNEQLLAVAKHWLKSKEVENWIVSGGKEKEGCWIKKNLGTDKYYLSEPFFVGIPEYKDKKNGLIMVVGQETNQWGNMKNIYKGEFNDDNMARSQNWVVQATANINGMENNPKWQNYEGKDAKVNVSNAAFFNFLKKLAEKYNVCWNNLDKIHYNAVLNEQVVNNSGKNTTKKAQKDKVVTLYEEDETILGATILDGKSLLQREIEIIKPDIVLFLTGPSYKHSIEQSIGNKIFELKKQPSWEHKIVEGNTQDNIRYLWTYHPVYLRRKSIYDKVLQEIFDILDNKKQND